MGPMLPLKARLVLAVDAMGAGEDGVEECSSVDSEVYRTARILAARAHRAVGWGDNDAAEGLLARCCRRLLAAEAEGACSEAE